jgi:hypothetical protein
MSTPIPANENLVPNNWYEITAVESDPAPSLPVGTVLQCAESRAGCIDPTCINGVWLADHNGAGFQTRATAVGFVRPSNPLED